MENKNIKGFALEWILFQKYFAAKIFRLNIVYSYKAFYIYVQYRFLNFPLFHHLHHVCHS